MANEKSGFANAGMIGAMLGAMAPMIARESAKQYVATSEEIGKLASTVRSAERSSEAHMLKEPADKTGDEWDRWAVDLAVMVHETDMAKKALQNANKSVDHYEMWPGHPALIVDKPNIIGSINVA